MLVLSRKVSEELVIGNTVRVVVLKVAGGRVKLGVSAPNDVTVVRKELGRRHPKAASTPSGPGVLRVINDVRVSDDASTAAPSPALKPET